MAFSFSALLPYVSGLSIDVQKYTKEVDATCKAKCSVTIIDQTHYLFSFSYRAEVCGTNKYIISFPNFRRKFRSIDFNLIKYTVGYSSETKKPMGAGKKCCAGDLSHLLDIIILRKEIDGTKCTWIELAT